MPARSKKINFAKEQLEDGIRLFFEERYISALTLLGAATEVFDAFYKKKTGVDPLDHQQLWVNHIRTKIGNPHISKRELQKINRDSYNLVKHHSVDDPEIVNFDRFGEAFMKIQMATSYADALELNYKHRRKYKSWVKKNFSA